MGGEGITLMANHGLTKTFRVQVDQFSLALALSLALPPQCSPHLHQRSWGHLDPRVPLIHLLQLPIHISLLLLSLEVHEDLTLNVYPTFLDSCL